MFRTHRTLIALALAAFASALLAQQADKNTAGPTKNDYRLRVIEPAEGSILAGSALQVTVDMRIPPEVGGDRKDSNSMPAPRVTIYVDDQQKGMLNDMQNTMTIDNVAPGQHTLVIVATNKSNEIIDRKVVKFSMSAASSVASTEAPKTAPSASSAPPPPASVPAYSAPATTSSPASNSASNDDQTSSTLPKTGTSNALALGAGLTLIAGGLILRRRSL